MSVDKRFNTFLKNITLTQNQLEDAKTKYDGVCKKLHDYYYSNTPYTGSTKLLIGSYGKNTNIRPPRDVDVMFIMPYEKFEQYNSHEGNAQSQLLQDIRSILLEKYPDVNIRGDGQVVVLPFEGGHNIELVPAWLLNNGKYYIPDTHEGGTWKTVDPKDEIKNIQDSDDRSNGNTRNLIRMIKAWQLECNVPIKSLAIELRAVNFLNNYQYYDKSAVYYDWMIRDYFAELLKHVNNTCKMPGLDEKIDYGDEWKSKAESALSRAIKACEYESKKDEYNATLEWKKIFGDDFNF